MNAHAAICRSGIKAHRMALPASAVDIEGFFNRALSAISLCEDVAVTAASSAARAYIAGASGALRHALGILVNEGRIGARESAENGFDSRKAGRSELIGGADGWDTVLRCRLPDASTGTVRALWPVHDHLAGIWLRPDAALPDLWVRGSLAEEDGELCFQDEPARDLGPRPCARHDLGRDLLTSGPDALIGSPALARSVEVALVSGSWCHAGTGARWFCDAVTARAIVRLMGGAEPVEPSAQLRLRGVVDREALRMVEEVGWRHIPTPRFDA